MSSNFQVLLPGYVPPLTLHLLIISGTNPDVSYPLTHDDGLYHVSLQLVGRYSLRIRNTTEIVAMGYVDLVDGEICEPVGTLGELDADNVTFATVTPNVLRTTTDTDGIRFIWPASTSTISGVVFFGNEPHVPINGVISFLRTDMGIHYYELSYNQLDRRLGPVRYRFTDGIRTGFTNLSVMETTGITLSDIAGRLFSDPNEKLFVIDGEVSTINGGLAQLPTIPNRLTNNGSPVYRLSEVVYIRESAAEGFLEPATILGIRLTKTGWLYSITSGTTSNEMLHGDRRRISNQNIIELPENAFVDKIQANVLVHNALVIDLDANDSQF